MVVTLKNVRISTQVRSQNDPNPYGRSCKCSSEPDYTYFKSDVVQVTLIPLVQIAPPPWQETACRASADVPTGLTCIENGCSTGLGMASREKP